MAWSSAHAARRDVLELVHQHVAVRRLPATVADVRRGVVDEVVEVLLLAQQLVVAGADLLEDVEEGLATGALTRVTRPLTEGVGRDAAGLDVVEERRHELRQPGDQPAAQLQEQRADWDALEGDARLLELLTQALAKHACALLPAVRLDQPCPVLLVDVALPADALGVAGPSFWRRPCRSRAKCSM